VEIATVTVTVAHEAAGLSLVAELRGTKEPNETHKDCSRDSSAHRSAGVARRAFPQAPNENVDVTTPGASP
jgi:hypothetical protein